MIKNVLSIAGSDPSGGAGVQADLKTFAALGCYGMAVVTALTAQNTQGVRGIHDVPPDFLRGQLEAVFDDVRVDAVKIGMAGTADSIGVIADVLERYKPAHIVLDPVMVATSGDMLLSSEAREVLVSKLFPLVSVVTPNIPEGEALLGRLPVFEDMAEDLLSLGCPSVFLTGGHGDGAFSRDILAGPDGSHVFEAERLEIGAAHGTGCSLSSALASFLARGLPITDAAGAAKDYVYAALKASKDLGVGGGARPVQHFHALWSKIA